MKTLEEKIRLAAREAEIKVRVEHAQWAFNDMLGEDTQFIHFATKTALHAAMCGWDKSTKQRLSKAVEAKRLYAEKQINQELHDIFGVADDTTVYLICEKEMTKMGLYW